MGDIHDKVRLAAKKRRWLTVQMLAWGFCLCTPYLISHGFSEAARLSILATGVCFGWCLGRDNDWSAP